MSNDYDDMKKWLSIGRKLQENALAKKTIKEQITPSSQVAQPNLQQQQQQQQQSGAEEKTDVDNINSVDIKIVSSDEMDLELKKEEKAKISELIDKFKTEVSKSVELPKMTVMPNTVKLECNEPTYKLQFIYSAGDDEGLYLTNISTLEINEDTMSYINKLLSFKPNYVSLANEIMEYRKNN